MDFSEKWGIDVEEAVRLALIDLKLERDQVEVIVLEEPSKGFLGFGSKLAKVRVQKATSKQTPAKPAESGFQKTQKPERTEVYKKPPVTGFEKVAVSDRETVAVTDRSRTPQQRETVQNTVEKTGRNRRRNSGNNRNGDQEFNRKGTNIRIRPDDLKALEDAPALGFLKEVTKRMGLDLEVTAMENNECLYFDISGKDSGTIIGKRGQTLDSIQYLTSLVVNKESDKYNRVVVDAENYRQKREKTLEQLALRLAEKVKKTGKSVRLEPMNPYERKVIHATLQKNPSVTTRSEGEEPYRRVIIEQK